MYANKVFQSMRLPPSTVSSHTSGEYGVGRNCNQDREPAMARPYLFCQARFEFFDHTGESVRPLPPL
jgi:hypothetical protein